MDSTEINVIPEPLLPHSGVRLGAEIRIIEVGPRDGLQNEKCPISTDAKLEFVSNLVKSGLKEIELTSFVSPTRIPQLADADELWSKVLSSEWAKSVQFSALVPNLRGLDRALKLGVSRIALFTAASSSFTKKNIGMTIEESIAEFKKVIEEFRGSGGEFVRGYVSTIVECPFEGRISPSQVSDVVGQLIDLGVDEISLGETLGVAVPVEIESVLGAVLPLCKHVQVACHFHDTRGTGIANIQMALSHGITRFDSSAGGLGGCPYAPGAGGNLATEDLVYYLTRSGYSTGVDLDKLSHSSLDILRSLGRSPSAKSQLADLG